MANRLFFVILYPVEVVSGKVFEFFPPDVIEAYFKAKMHQIRFRLGLPQTPLEELTALPRPSGWI